MEEGRVEVEVLGRTVKAAVVLQQQRRALLGLGCEDSPAM